MQHSDRAQARKKSTCTISRSKVNLPLNETAARCHPQATIHQAACREENGAPKGAEQGGSAPLSGKAPAPRTLGPSSRNRLASFHHSTPRIGARARAALYPPSTAAAREPALQSMLTSPQRGYALCSTAGRRTGLSESSSPPPAPAAGPRRAAACCARAANLRNSLMNDGQTSTRNPRPGGVGGARVVAAARVL